MTQFLDPLASLADSGTPLIVIYIHIYSLVISHFVHLYYFLALIFIFLHIRCLDNPYCCSTISLHTISYHSHLCRLNLSPRLSKGAILKAGSISPVRNIIGTCLMSKSRFRNLLSMRSPSTGEVMHGPSVLNFML